MGAPPRRCPPFRIARLFTGRALRRTECAYADEERANGRTSRRNPLLAGLFRQSGRADRAPHRGWGGLDKLRALKSVRLTGTTRFGQGEDFAIEASYGIVQKRPGNMRVEVTFQGLTGARRLRRP